MAGGSLVKSRGGSLIPSRTEIVKDLVRWFAGEYGLDVAEAMFAKLDTPALIELWKKRKGKASSSSGGFGLGVLAIAALALHGTKKKRRR